MMNLPSDHRPQSLLQHITVSVPLDLKPLLRPCTTNQMNQVRCCPGFRKASTVDMYTPRLQIHPVDDKLSLITTYYHAGTIMAATGLYIQTAHGRV